MSAARFSVPVVILLGITAGIVASAAMIHGRLGAPRAAMLPHEAPPSERATAERAGAGATVDAGTPRSPTAPPDHIDAIIVGGGPSPDANQVQIEDEVAAATGVLGDGTWVLFGGGPDTRAVQVRDGSVETDPLRSRLGELFAPRDGRDARYRATALSVVHGPATIDALVPVISLAFAETDAPLTLVLIGHGAPGDAPFASQFLTWGGVPIDAIALDAFLTPEPGAPVRPVRVVATQCFSGGLAEIAFADAEPGEGPTPLPRCGLFATRWDREAAGCDADPDRGAHEGYARHFFSALAGHAIDGSDARPAIDLDGDDVITLLEAHTRARIASRSIDVPTTTSVRLLHQIAPSEDAAVVPWDDRRIAALLPEEQAVIAALSDVLDERTAERARTRQSEIAATIAEAEAALESTTADADAAWTVLTAELLSRWPVLDDPFHPAFDDTLAAEGEAIAAFLDGSSAMADLSTWTEQNDALAASIEALELEHALALRLLDAHETMALAARAAAASGAAWDRYLAMRACEDGAP